MQNTALKTAILLLTAVGLTGCTDNPLGRWIGAVGGCAGGNAYQFKLAHTPMVTLLHIEGQTPVISASVPLTIGRPCESLQGGSSDLQGVRVLRNGTAIPASGSYELGTYLLRFNDAVLPGSYRYDVQGMTDNTPAAAVLGRTTFDVAASPIQGFARLGASSPNLPQGRLNWNAVNGHNGYRLRFAYSDPASGTQQVAVMNLSPTVTSYQLGTPVAGDPVIEEGRTIGLPAAIADSRNTGLKPGLRLSVTIGAFRFQPGDGANRLTSGFDWEHRSLPITLSP
ncbi:MAG: hypothetical protein H7338_09270 [Candidatus Sericytochromatia bacterium]|nr:hypothetical protein [Candidatus Sericytochromatia bacterium]